MRPCERRTESEHARGRRTSPRPVSVASDSVPATATALRRVELWGAVALSTSRVKPLYRPSLGRMVRSTLPAHLWHHGLTLRGPASSPSLLAPDASGACLPARGFLSIGASYFHGGRNLHTITGMVTLNDNGLVRVTVTLQPADVEMLDELARIEGSNRSQELRSLLDQVRPMIDPILSAFREMQRQREQLDQKLVNATLTDLEAIQPEVEDIGRRFMGMMAKFEGAATAGEAPASNTGATNS